MSINAARTAKCLVGIVASLLILSAVIHGHADAAQRLNEPKLIKTWIGGEDYGEFLDNTAAELSSYVKENPDSKAIVRICSGEKMPAALASSAGFPVYFFEAMRRWDVSPENIYLARSSKCRRGSKAVFDEYWFVPEDSNFHFDEIIRAEKLSYKRLSIGYHKNEESRPAKKEFTDKTKEFVEELKNNPTAEGFIVASRNNRFIERNLRKALRQIRNEKLTASRVRVVRKSGFANRYPEFMTITIKE